MSDTTAETPRAAETNGGGRRPSYVVGVGASAGGLEALQQFFSSVAENSGAAFVVVQHLSPDFKSLVDELLARYTSIPIVQAEDGMSVERDTIYLMPTKSEMILSGGRLLLTEKDPHEGLTLPIDHFFRTLAGDAGAKAVGIVLSGTGSDGSRGVRDIHEAGGCVLVQSPESAKFDGMPRSALDSGMWDFSLPPDQLAEALHEHIGVVSEVERSKASDQFPETATDALFRLLNEAYGIDFSQYKSGTITRRIDRRIMLTRVAGLEAYVEQLKDDRKELDSLYQDILIGVTHFFRDPDAFSVLESKVVRDQVANTPDDEEIRVWVAGCATGEEAYSLAILFLDQMQATGIRRVVRIFATDVHQESLDVADAGVYTDASLANISEERRQRYFRFDGAHYTIIPELRQMVVFARHNIINDAPFTKLSLVSCRNLLIYLQPEAQKKALSLCHFGLKTGGVMFLGPSEHVGGLEAEFDDIDEHWRLLRKRRHIRLPDDMRLLTPQRPPAVPAMRGLPALSTPAYRGDLLSLYDELLTRFMPLGFLVNDKRELIHSFGDAHQFLTMKGGRQLLDICDLTSGNLRAAIISAMQQVVQKDEDVRCHGIRIEVDGVDCLYALTVHPITEEKSRIHSYLLLLEQEGKAAESPEPVHELDVSEIEATAVLESELRYTRENLQATIEELETSNEELQATNEELIASNEELQSTNEELNSVNEELYTVNAEYQSKILDLTSLNNDMDNLLSSTEIGTIFLDSNLNIRKFTPRAASYTPLLPQDVGRPFRAFAHQLDAPQLHDDIDAVLASSQIREEEVQSDDGKSLLLRILPYIAEGKADGVVITLVDVTTLTETQNELRRRTAELETIFQTSPVGLAIFDRNHKYLRINDALAEINGMAAPDHIGRTISDVIPELADEVEPLIEGVFQSGQETPLLEVRGVTPAQPDVERDWLACYYPVMSGNEVLGVGAVVTEITELTRAQRALEQRTNELELTNKELEEFAYVASHDLQEPLRAITGYCQALAEDCTDSLDDTGREYLEFIVDGAHRMQQLIDDLLEYSRIGRMETAVESVDLNVEFDHVRAQLDALIEETGAAVTADPLPRVHANATRMSQLLQNLVANAIRFQQAGVSPEVHISVSESDGLWEFAVRDNGIGIESKHFDRIFLVFHRLHTRREYPGTGVGLALCKKIVEQAGGRIWLDSQPGEGSTFHFTLPR